MKKWLWILGLSLTSAIVGFKAEAQTALYTDRAVGVAAIGGNATAVLVPIANGQVRVCTVPASGSPCTPLAAINDTGGNPLTVTGGNFGQLSTDIVGRFSFQCVATQAIQIQVAGTGSNVPQLSYPVQCPGALVQTLFNPNFQVLTVGGTFTIPSGVTRLVAEVQGGGGAGGGANTGDAGAQGGCSGGYIRTVLSGLTPGLTITVAIGTGGTGVVNASGNPGTASSISSGTQAITTFTAGGGGGGLVNGSLPNCTGGTVSAPISSSTISSVGTVGGYTEFDVLGTARGGQGGNSAFAAGGAQTTAGSAGSGGGGRDSLSFGAGGAGGAGLVVFSWVN